MSEVGELFSRKEHKVRKGLKLKTRNPKLTEGKPFIPRGLEFTHFLNAKVHFTPINKG